MTLSNGTTVPLIDYIAISHAHGEFARNLPLAVGRWVDAERLLVAAALEEAKQMETDWSSLEGLIHEPRFSAVAARFEQQNVDALSFSEVIVGFYLNISGHHFP